jgi:hypothetical protein
MTGVHAFEVPQYTCRHEGTNACFKLKDMNLLETRCVVALPCCIQLRILPVSLSSSAHEKVVARKIAASCKGRAVPHQRSEQIRRHTHTSHSHSH